MKWETERKLSAPLIEKSNIESFDPSFITKRPKLWAQMVRPVDGLRASSIVWGQIRRPDSTDPDDGHMYLVLITLCYFTCNATLQKNNAIIWFLSKAQFVLRFPLRFGLLFQGEGTYPKKLDVKTFPICSSNRGASKLQWSEMPSKQKALVCPKTATKILY